MQGFELESKLEVQNNAFLWLSLDKNKISLTK